MKHLLSFLFVIGLLVFSFSYSNKQSEIFSYFTQGDCFFVVSKDANISNLPAEINTILNGDDIIISAKTSLAKYIFQTLEKSKIKGFSFKFESTFKSFKQNLNFKYFKGEHNENANHYYAFFNNNADFVFVKGKKVNAHIVEKENNLIVGFPIILTSY